MVRGEAKDFSSTSLLTTSLLHWIYGELAQLGERLLCTQEVAGSIPAFSTRGEGRKAKGLRLTPYDLLFFDNGIGERELVGLRGVSLDREALDLEVLLASQEK